jgi:hypothetical protein
MIFNQYDHVPERRTDDNLYVSILVDLGVTYERILGPESAREFFVTQVIPLAIVKRILSTTEPRRQTEWERTVTPPEANRPAE